MVIANGQMSPAGSLNVPFVTVYLPWVVPPANATGAISAAKRPTTATTTTSLRRARPCHENVLISPPVSGSGRRWFWPADDVAAVFIQSPQIVLAGAC